MPPPSPTTTSPPSTGTGAVQINNTVKLQDGATIDSMTVTNTGTVEVVDTATLSEDASPTPATSSRSTAAPP